MINRALEILKNNTILIMLYLAMVALNLVFMVAFYPSDFSTTDPIEVLARTGILLGLTFVLLVVGLVFFAGFGKMLAEAVEFGTTSFENFLPALKKYIGKLILLALLMLAFYLVFAIIAGIFITIVVLIISATGSLQHNVEAMLLVTVVSMGAMYILLLPFVLLVLPAVFMDELGVIDTLKIGMKAGLKNYGMLVITLIAMYAPTLVYTVVNLADMKTGAKFTSEYIGFSILNAGLALFVLTIMFIIYKDWRVRNTKVDGPIQMEIY